MTNTTARSGGDTDLTLEGRISDSPPSTMVCCHRGGPEVSGTAIYTCGPEPLLRAVEEQCGGRWPTGSLHLERFAPKQIVTGGDTPFEIELPDGQALQVPADRTALEVLEDAGFDILSSCREGTCGTCEVAIVVGEADHRDSVLTPEEQADNSCMMVCLSRAAGPRLVLDL